MNTTTGKAKVAAIGCVLSVATAVITALSDGELSSTELTGIVELTIVAAGTVCAVWKKRNYQIPDTSQKNTPESL